MATGSRGKGWGRRFRSWSWGHRYHILFSVALLTLAVLIGWWGVLIHRTVDERRDGALRRLDLETRLLATMLGHVQGRPQLPPDVEKEGELEVGPCVREPGGIQHTLAPLYPKSCIRARPEVLADIEREHRRKTAMLVGEASLTVILIVLTGFMLFRLIYIENRSARELRDLWSRVTHELKTPITGLKALIQTLQSQELTREELLPLLDMAMGEVQRQEHLAENLLVGQRLGGVTHQVLGAVEPVPWMREYLMRPRLRLPGDRIQLDVRCQEDLVVTADPNGLRIVFDNLVDNAIKYGGEDLRVRVALTTEGDWMRVVFQDNGPGFEPEVAEAIFRAYRRLSDAPGATRQGTGMGLHIARRLAREMGGELHAASDGPGTGGRFILTLKIRGGRVDGQDTHR
jgi:two-component system phosphate regulon sensor histidine kinase PhoR